MMVSARHSTHRGPASRASAGRPSGQHSRTAARIALGSLLLVAARAAGAAPRVAVLDCKIAQTWLNEVGIECASLPTLDSPGSDLPGIQLLVLPLDRVRS